MTLTLPYPPTANHATIVSRGRRIKSPKARDYANDVVWRTLIAAGSAALNSDHRLAVTLAVHPPDKRRRDLANTEKLVVDAVFAALGLDDSQIDRLNLERHPPDRPHGKLVMTIEAIA